MNKLPASPEVERLLLGSIFLTAAGMDILRPMLELEDFSLDKHQRIWRRCCELYDTGEVVDRITVYSRIDQHGDSEAVGGLSYLVDLTEGLPYDLNITSYALVLKEQTTRRRIMRTSYRFALQAMEEVKPASEVLDQYGSAIAELTQGTSDLSKRALSGPDVITNKGVDMLLANRRHQGVALPWTKLDHDLQGFGPSQMIVLMAQTSRGKTSAALQVAYAAAIQGLTPIVWTMEMSPESLLRRLVTQISGVSGREFATAQERQAQREAVAQLMDCPIWFDSHSRTVSSFCASVRQVRSQARAGIAIVDYLQLIRSEESVSNRAQEVSHNSRALKLAAMDFGIPFLVLSQVDRSSVKGGGEISLHSGKESGDIENDADVVMWVKGTELLRDSDTPVTMWIGKQREGAAGFGVPMVFHPRSQTFEEVTEHAGN